MTPGLLVRCSQKQYYFNVGKGLEIPANKTVTLSPFRFLRVSMPA